LKLHAVALLEIVIPWAEARWRHKRGCLLKKIFTKWCHPKLVTKRAMYCTRYIIYTMHCTL